MTQRIIPNLWFTYEASEAARFYVEIFGGSVLSAFGEGPTDPTGAVQPVTVEWEVLGTRFVGINGGPGADGEPYVTPNEAVSLEIDFADQAELERVWHALLDGGGEPSMCGWLKDRYGFSWQLVPTALLDAFKGSDAEGTARALQVMYATDRVPLDGPKIRAAYEGA